MMRVINLISINFCEVRSTSKKDLKWQVSIYFPFSSRQKRDAHFQICIKKSYAMQKEIILRLRRIDHLIRIKGTGSPATLAKRIGISERSIYGYLNLMKD